MVTRSLTEVFILMRNNAMQSRRMFAEHVEDEQVSDRVSLMRRDSIDLEAGNRDVKPPPEWLDGLEEVQYTISRIRGKLRELVLLQKKETQRPTLDDSTADQKQIEILTEEITKMLASSNRVLQQIKYRSSGASRQEERLAQNIVASLAAALQDISNEFRKSQSHYLKSMQSREETSQQYFPDNFSDVGSPRASQTDDFLFEQSHLLMDGTVTQQQLLLLEDNTAFVAQREKEVQHIVRSIVELNTLFKDIAGMVVDQGTILDRIDYNVEMTEVKVHEGLQQLQKAEGHHRKNRKMMCILILAGITVLLLLLLIITKS